MVPGLTWARGNAESAVLGRTGACVSCRDVCRGVVQVGHDGIDIEGTAVAGNACVDERQHEVQKTAGVILERFNCTTTC